MSVNGCELEVACLRKCKWKVIQKNYILRKLFGVQVSLEERGGPATKEPKGSFSSNMILWPIL